MKRMGRSEISLAILLLLFAATAVAQPAGIKRWSYQNPLQWSDFTGKPDSPETHYAAATYAGLELDVVEAKFAKPMIFKVWAVFDCNRSWVHPERRVDEVLEHEQLHFDIAEAYARRLERKLNALKLKPKDKKIAKKLHAKYNQAQMKEQQRFDKECVHGLNRENQLVWRSRLDRELLPKKRMMRMAAAQK